MCKTVEITSYILSGIWAGMVSNPPPLRLGVAGGRHLHDQQHSKGLRVGKERVALNAYHAGNVSHWNGPVMSEVQKELRVTWMVYFKTLTCMRRITLRVQRQHWIGECNVQKSEQLSFIWSRPQCRHSQYLSLPLGPGELNSSVLLQGFPAML